MRRVMFGLCLGLWLCAFGANSLSAFAADAPAPGLGAEDKAVMRDLYLRMPQANRDKQLAELRGRELILNRRLNAPQAQNEQTRRLILAEISRLHDEIDILEAVSGQGPADAKTAPAAAPGFLDSYGLPLGVLAALILALAAVTIVSRRRSRMDLSGGQVDNVPDSKLGNRPRETALLQAAINEPLPAPVALQDMQAHVDHLALEPLTPYIKIVNFILEQAILWHASDIHIQREGDWVEVRFRLDGQLFGVASLHPRGEREVLNIVKNMTRLKIYENRAAQEGRLEYFFGGRWYDLRISIVPVHNSEKVVARIFGDDEIVYELDRLGLSLDTTEKLEDILSQKHGLLLVVGPAGSGKTTSIYSFLNYLYRNRQGINITTLEDPVEHKFEHFSQIQINPAKALSFEQGFSNILRQDPEVVMIGEIRESAVAQLVVRAAQTGHLVISTIHSPTTVGAVDRLLELGVDPYALFGILNGVLSQRLTKKVCARCLRPYTPDPSLARKALQALGPYAKPDWQRGQGCEFCMGKAHRGRVAIDELLAVRTSAEREALASITNRSQLREKLGSHINHSLYEDAVLKAAGGLTTLEEVESTLGDLATLRNPLGRA